MRSRVKTIHFVEHGEMRPVPDHYTFNKDKKHHWLQNLCLWTLRKLDCGYMKYDIISETRIVIDPDDIVDKLFQSLDVVEELNRRGPRPANIIMGAEDLDELMGCGRAPQLFEFSGQYNYGRQIVGLKVTVVPWMEGMVVMP